MDTIVISDLHLSDADTGRTDKPFWKAYKRKEHFFDDDLVRMIRHVEAEAEGGVELILNGDVFDFDNVALFFYFYDCKTTFFKRNRMKPIRLIQCPILILQSSLN